MGLKPQTVFLGIIAFGLPIALTTGWTLARGSTVAEPSGPGGAGVFGHAPRVGTPAVPTPLSAPVTDPPLRPVADHPRTPVTARGPAQLPTPAPITRTARPGASFSPPPVPVSTSPSPGPSGEPPSSAPTAAPSPGS